MNEEAIARVRPQRHKKKKIPKVADSNLGQDLLFKCFNNRTAQNSQMLLYIYIFFRNAILAAVVRYA